MAKKSVYVEQVHAREEKGRKKWPLVIAGVAVLAVAGGIGSTFAANITINGNNDVEFAQGTQVVSACDNTITTALTSRVQSAVFYVDTIKISDFDTTACAGKNLVVRLADSGDNLDTIGTSDNTFLSINVDTLVAASGDPIELAQGGSAELTDGLITITPYGGVLASNVDKVLLETN